MGFIESIQSEFFHQVEKLAGFILGNAFLMSPLNKAVPVFGHDFGDLFSHGFSQVIRFGHGIIGQLGRNLHDLFLINDNAVGFL